MGVAGCGGGDGSAGAALREGINLGLPGLLIAV